MNCSNTMRINNLSSSRRCLLVPVTQSTGCLFFPPLSQPWPDFLSGWGMACAVCYLQRVWPGQLPDSSVSTSVSGASAGTAAAMWCQITSCALWSDKEECCWTGNSFLCDAFWRPFALNSERLFIMLKQNLISIGWTPLDNVDTFYPLKSAVFIVKLGVALLKKLLYNKYVQCYDRLFNHQI